ncbi:bifunctional precorrin-2 dehydrogenase/sirohydrochlorin ferrochelatase [Aquihabitans sp. G128]|uniref:precorrin-2 dehydrogenase/sirohydrochlorin ferrochelatase family protein n=1 Tax=Aquihabitans sp. G128 TaxID=2849779 RepID=UPI001C2115E2|nr:bifunctional precorrin-2 dehydrogenase/sirohydrochlorin ferrochelatase [Aquihabitans sp. G128]QXC60141.1 bifunctional precorrin-2 dehydrogenase/sirohydrochlorin ferrochelatase [Aquihabitans sp. G128]
MGEQAARYPVLLDLDGRRCLVVGGGRVAERKVQGLLGVGAAVTVLAPTTTEALGALARSGAVAWQERSYETADLAGEPWAFVVAATDHPAVNRQVVADATTAGTWANDASAADGGPAALPAVHRDGPLTLAVSTGGVHPGAATWLRDLAAGAIGPEHLVALRLLAESRASSPLGDAPRLAGGRRVGNA